MEPTANALHAGCVGNINARIVAHGRSGHSRAAVDGGQRDPPPRRRRSQTVAAQPYEEREFEGLTFVEAMSVVTIEGGIAQNVIPDRAEALVNYRYAPGRAPERGRAPPARPRSTAWTSRSSRTRRQRRRPARQRGRRRGCAPWASRGSPSRRGRRSPSSRSPASTRSTSGPASRASPTPARSRCEIAALQRTYEVLERAVRLSPVLTEMTTYPFVRLTEAKRRLAADGVEVVDFGMGEPREETPAFIRAAVAREIEAEPVSAYPLAEGVPTLRAAIAAWVERRFGVGARPEHRGHPDARARRRRSSRSPRSSTARSACRRRATRCPARGALFAGREVVDVPLTRRERLAARPRRAAVGPPRPAVAQHARQPDRRRGADRASSREAAERCRAPRRRPRLRRGLQRAVVRGRSARRRGCRPAARTSSPSTRSPSARRCPGTAAASRRATRA